MTTGARVRGLGRRVLRRHGSAVSMVALLLGAPIAARAQEGLQALGAQRRHTVEDLAAAQARVAERDRAWVAIGARLDSARAAARAAVEAQEPAFGEAGPFRIIAAPDRLSDAERAVETAWRRFEPFVSRPDVYLGQRPLMLVWPGDPPLRREELPQALEPTTIQVRRALFGTGRARSDVERHFSYVLGRELKLPDFDRLDPGWAYRVVMTADREVVTECITGSGPACWSALGFGSASPAWKAWLRPGEYRDAVARLKTGSWGGIPLDVDPERCLSLGEPSVCERVLEEVEERRVVATSAPPLQSDNLYADLAVFAAERGGDGAFERLQPSLGGDLRDRVAAAARMDPDALIVEWVRGVISGPRDRDDDSRRKRSAALLWYLLFAIPAARSSRWRLD